MVHPECSACEEMLLRIEQDKILLQVFVTDNEHLVISNDY
jgi:hypothetical protein